jgi:hypothetical protein
MEESFPFLFKNKPSDSKTGNVSKLTTNAFRRGMIYVARLYQARITMSELYPGLPVPPMDFASFPLLHDIFTAFEEHLKKIATDSKTPKADKSSVSSLVDDIRKTFTACKKGMDIISTVMVQMADIQGKLDKVGKKVKVLEKKRVKKRARSPEFSEQDRKKLMKLLGKGDKKRKKKKKSHEKKQKKRKST